jgi:hypothetical protein
MGMSRLFEYVFTSARAHCDCIIIDYPWDIGIVLAVIFMGIFVYLT